jgi:hypothetical protein
MASAASSRLMWRRASTNGWTYPMAVEARSHLCQVRHVQAACSRVDEGVTTHPLHESQAPEGRNTSM